MLRRTISIVTGVIAAGAVIYLVEAISHALYVPTGVTTDSANMAEVVRALPTGAKLLVILGWFAGAALGGALAIRLSGWTPGAWIVAAVLLAGVIATLVSIPHPWWMAAAGIFAPLVGALAAVPIARWSARRAEGRI